MRVLRSLLSTLAVALLALWAPLAQARDASPAPIDCSTSGAMMQQAMKMPPPAMTGTLDHDAIAMMQMHATMMRDMARLEAACGTDSKMRAMAQQVLGDSIDLINRIQRLTSGNQ